MILTVLDAINKSTEYFQKKNIESPRTNAELLLADILKCKRLDLYLMFDRPLDNDQVSSYREYIARRGNREPLQYITGKVEFYGLDFFVDKSVLIPRQETEILIETVINENKELGELIILDIGTGSGNIPVCLAKFLDANVTSIDKSEEALLTADKNMRLNGVESKVILKELDVYTIDKNNFEDTFHIIVSNPPYVSAEEYKNLQEEIAVHEPGMAVTDSSDGYAFYEHIAAACKHLLKPSGKIYFEVGQGQSDNVKSILQKNGFTNIRSIKDYLNIERIVIGEYT